MATKTTATEEAKVAEKPETAQAEDANDLVVVKYDRLFSYCQSESIEVEGVVLKHGRNNLTKAEVAILEKPEYEFFRKAWEVAK